MLERIRKAYRRYIITTSLPDNSHSMSYVLSKHHKILLRQDCYNCTTHKGEDMPPYFFFFSTSTTSLKPFSVFQLIVHERHHVLYAAEIHIALPIGLGLSQRQADLLNAISQSHSDCTLHTARLGRFRKTMSECSLFCRVLFLFLFYTTILLFFSLFL